jgi:hypothetical protein
MSDIRHDILPGQIRTWTQEARVFFVIEVDGVRCNLMQDGKIQRRHTDFVFQNSTIIVV